jgi:3-oxoacyl-[acyl-carrier protein] reductase
MYNRLNGKVALITGAASGIGRAQAELFAREGAVVVAADLNRRVAEQVVSEIEAAGGSGLAVTMDVRDAGSVDAGVTAAVDKFTRIDILSNTAGVFDDYHQALDTTRELWDTVVGVNLTGVHLVTSAVLPVMLEGGGGTVVSIASGAGLVGGGGGAAYTSSKHAVIGYTRQLTAGYGRQGIRANAIAPGLIDTPMVAHISHTAETEAWMANQPGGRLGRPEDIAKAALFLVSDESDYIHGVTLPVDGGLINTL